MRDCRRSANSLIFLWDSGVGRNGLCKGRRGENKVERLGACFSKIRGRFLQQS